MPLENIFNYTRYHQNHINLNTKDGMKLAPLGLQIIGQAHQCLSYQS